ncbi:hypothetical protein ANN_04623 [Periplaneta americana]|uniref:Uncharacterized protein n=1 Tax=Periplaneta americana TaxID=6978 RepID=A0ABQ8T8X9_PERAM|nr:hypothetical protein ANN_04623 [Periplaneta americana]
MEDQRASVETQTRLLFCKTRRLLSLLLSPFRVPCTFVMFGARISIRDDARSHLQLRPCPERGDTPRAYSAAISRASEANLLVLAASATTRRDATASLILLHTTQAARFLNPTENDCCCLTINQFGRNDVA